MGRKHTSIKIHGEILRDLIVAHSSVKGIAKELGVSRQMVHAYISKGLISPAYLAKLVTILNLSKEDVQILDRQRETAAEKLILENRRLKDALCEMRKLIEECLR